MRDQCCGIESADPGDVTVSALCWDCPVHLLMQTDPADYKLRYRSPHRSRAARGLTDAAKANARTNGSGRRVQS